jgi:hypothetical protein
MATIADCITRTQRLVNSNTRSEIDEVSEHLASTTDTTLIVTHGADGIRVGSYLSISSGTNPPETVYVHKVNGKNVTIQRAMDGSSGFAWQSGSMIEVEPRFSGFQILEAVRETIRSLPNNLYGVSTASAEFSTTAQSVAVAAMNDQDHGTPGTGFYHLISATRTARDQEDRLLDMNCTVQRQTDGTYKVVRQEKLEKGVTVNLIYAHPFKSTTLNLDTDLGSTVKMPESMTDIPSLGASARLLLGEESLRLDLHAQGDSRSDASVAAGDRARYSMILQGQYDRRVSEEARRLMSLYGIRSGASVSSVFPTTLLR